MYGAGDTLPGDLPGTLSNSDVQRAGRLSGCLEQGRRGRGRGRRRDDSQPRADPGPATLPDVEPEGVRDSILGGQAAARAAASDRPVRQATAKRKIAPPAKIPRAPTEMATPSASEAPTPAAMRAAPLTPTCVAAPAGPTGNAAAAAPAQRKRSASGNEKPTPSVPRSKKTATARTSQHANTNPHACAAACHEVVRGPSQRPTRKRRGRRARGQAGQGHDHGGGRDSGESHHRESRAHARAGARKQNGDEGERGEGDAVDQAEHHEGEAEHADTGRTAGVAADDRDPHRIVEAARKDNSDQRSATVAGRERKRLGSLVGREQPRPSVRLEGLGEQKEQARSRQQARVSARERPGGGREMPSGQQRQDDHKRSRSGGEHPLALSRAPEAPERADQQAIPALEHERCKRDGDRRQRVPLEAGARAEPHWASPFEVRRQ